MERKVTVLLVVSMSLLLSGCNAFPTGPLISACNDLLPRHPGSPASGNGGYNITTDIPLNTSTGGFEYTTGETYTVTLTGMDNTFLGFAVQSVSIVDESPLGGFTPGSNQQLLDCGGDHTIVHSNPTRMDFSEQNFMWQAPDTEGNVDFLYSVVRVELEYYVRLSAVGREPGPPATAPPPIQGSRPAGVIDPDTEPGNLSLIFRNPSSCSVSDCTIFVGIERNAGNESYLNFYIEGEASDWVAVGFSATASMFAADVLACNLNPDGDVEVLDTWNDAANRNNVADNIMDTFRINSSFTGGRIKCSFVRSIAGTTTGDVQEDLDLNDEYFVLFGGSNGGQSSGSLGTHRRGSDRNPSISGNRFNVVLDTGSQGSGNADLIKRALIQTHGILMLIAWVLLASTGIFFAVYMRQTLPNGEWFQVHRALMIGSLVIATISFFLIFVSQYNSRTPGLIDLGTSTSSQRIRVAHFVLGIIVMALHIVNPIIAIFRCHPGEKNRWIFDLVHGSPGIGMIAFILAFTNVAIGLGLFSMEFSRFGDLTLFWTFLWVAISFICQLTISGGFRKYYRFKNRDRNNDDFAVKMDKSDNVDISGQDNKKKEDGSCSKQSQRSKICYWVWTAVWVAIAALVVFVLIVLISLP